MSCHYFQLQFNLKVNNIEIIFYSLMNDKFNKICNFLGEYINSNFSRIKMIKTEVYSLFISYFYRT